MPHDNCQEVQSFRYFLHGYECPTECYTRRAWYRELFDAGIAIGEAREQLRQRARHLHEQETLSAELRNELTAWLTGSGTPRHTRTRQEREEVVDSLLLKTPPPPSPEDELLNHLIYAQRSRQKATVIEVPYRMLNEGEK